MTDMLRGWLLGCTHTDHNVSTLSLALRICPPPPVTQKLSNPSWKVIVSASRGQCLEPGSSEPAFLLWPRAVTPPAPGRRLPPALGAPSTLKRALDPSSPHW